MYKRYCTMPAIPWFRDWFEGKFGDLCEAHDDVKRCKLCGDWRFIRGIASRGYWYLVPFVYMAINMPWVWFEFEVRKV
jgi:hypothetical protein